MRTVARHYKYLQEQLEMREVTIAVDNCAAALVPQAFVPTPQVVAALVRMQPVELWVRDLKRRCPLRRDLIVNLHGVETVLEWLVRKSWRRIINRIKKSPGLELVIGLNTVGVLEGPETESVTDNEVAVRRALRKVRTWTGRRSMQCIGRPGPTIPT
jgi:hypothetical protein